MAIFLQPKAMSTSSNQGCAHGRDVAHRHHVTSISDVMTSRHITLERNDHGRGNGF